MRCIDLPDRNTGTGRAESASATANDSIHSTHAVKSAAADSLVYTTGNTGVHATSATNTAAEAANTSVYTTTNSGLYAAATAANDRG